MFRLRRRKDGNFEVHAYNGAAFEGTEQAITIAAQELGMHAEDIEIAKQELKRLDHDYAEFGIRGRFIFTSTDKQRAA